MSIAAQNIINQINLYVRQDPVRSYQNMRLNSILLQLVGLADGSGGGTSSGGVLKITGANFINVTDCPLIALDGDNLAVFYNPVQRYLVEGTEFNLLPGGGFTILLGDFNATTTNLTDEFYVQIQNN